MLRSGLFDPYAYAAAADLRGLGEQALIDHYLANPGGPSPQPRFDASRYSTLAGLAAGVDPFVHFLLHRPADGLAQDFNSATYLTENPDVRLDGWEPCRHFVELGWRQDRLAPREPPSDAPDFTGLRGRAALDGNIDVIVPVYRGRRETLRAIHSALSARVDADFRLLIIDDASPEPALSADLAKLEALGLVARMANGVNLGFTATANRGLAAGPGRDKVLLNADCEVHEGWLDTLRAHAYAAGNIGTVTPLSNAATILSYPIRLRDNHSALELSHAELAALAARLPHDTVEIPTGVGFCMFLRHDCLQAVGAFDEAAFPRGYGEENDFCLRAAKGGWRNLAAIDIFVSHRGSVSFGEERHQLVQKGLVAMEARHPGYRTQIADFNRADPLLSVRVQLDIARIGRAGHSGRLVHGAEPTTDDLVLRKLPGPADRFSIFSPHARSTPNLAPFGLRQAPQKTAKLLRRLGVDEIVIFEPAIIGQGAVAALRALANINKLRFRCG
ncbi:MAG TPA: glycosyltransferase [Caulobacteraceae bacterium]|nr:glycosyltransferase [Caulobacteraceae bacterium]